MGVQSLDRAFDIIELLSGERQGLSLTDICRYLELHKSTVHRLLNSLKGRGYIDQDEPTGFYRLGLGFIALSSQYLNNLEIKTEAEPHLRRLSHHLGKTVFLAILRDDEVMYLDKVERFDGLRRYSIIGQRAPVHCTSLGKSLVMEKSSVDLRALFQRRPMTGLTPQTKVHINDLLVELEISRIRGWSQDIEEHNVGVSCLAAPIKDYRGVVIAAISTAWEGPSDSQDVNAIAQEVKNTAQNISRNLGFLPDRHSP